MRDAFTTDCYLSMSCKDSQHSVALLSDSFPKGKVCIVPSWSGSFAGFWRSISHRVWFDMGRTSLLASSNKVFSFPPTHSGTLQSCFHTTRTKPENAPRFLCLTGQIWLPWVWSTAERLFPVPSRRAIYRVKFCWWHNYCQSLESRRKV